MADYLSKFSGEEIESLLDKIKDFNVINEIPSNSITSDKIANSTITTQKLGTDVTDFLKVLENNINTNKGNIETNKNNIKNNQYFARFNSDRLNILEAQINADKNTIEYTSDKALEITCNGANIVDCNAHFKKVEGQTRRYSPNLWKPNTKNITENGLTYSIEDNVLTLNGTCTKETSFNLIDPNNVFKNIGDNNYTILIKTNSVENYKKITWNFWYIGNVEPNVITTKFLQGEGELRVEARIPTGLTFNNLKVSFMLVKGNYTSETMPPFQPYDNTLVNSKATFVSSGRNLFKGGFVTKKPNGMTYTLKGTRLEISGTPTGLAFDYFTNVTLPKGTYFIEKSNMKGTIQGSNYIQLNKGKQWFANEGKITLNETTTLAICYTIGADNIGKSINASFDIMISYGSSTKPFEPYTKNISQYDIELGAYDYIENGNLVKQTSEMMTLNGSENWTTANDSKIIFIMNNFGETNNHRKAVINSTNWSYKPYETWISGSQGFDVQMYDNEQIRIDFNCDHIGIKTLEEWKAYLKANPITLVYKKATPTITPIVVPNGIVSYKDGLTSQFIKGKYLPYKYTAKYVNGGQQ